jgi:DNA-binding IclR family transcriptional regulator
MLPRAAERRAAQQGKDRRFVTALARGLELLRCFGPGDRHLGNQELARRSGLPKPTVSRLTHTLTELGYLRAALPGRGAGAAGYTLGPGVLALGYALLAGMDVRRVARPLMQSLAEHTGASVSLGMRDGLGVVYLDTYRSASSASVQLDVGSRLPLAATSMGRAYLGALTVEERRPLLEELRRADPSGWAAAKKGIDQSLRDLARLGFCFSLGDWRKDVHAVAVPLRPADRSDPFMFSCSGPAFEMGRARLEAEIGPRLLNLVGNVRSALSIP